MDTLWQTRQKRGTPSSGLSQSHCRNDGLPISRELVMFHPLLDTLLLLPLCSAPTLRSTIPFCHNTSKIAKITENNLAFLSVSSFCIAVWNTGFVLSLIFAPWNRSSDLFKYDLYCMYNDDINEYILQKNFCKDYMRSFI